MGRQQPTARRPNGQPDVPDEAGRAVAITSTGRHVGRVLDPEDPFREGRYDP